jgi:hypothetical protein
MLISFPACGLKLASAITFALLLTACGDHPEPTEAELQEQFQAQAKSPDTAAELAAANVQYHGLKKQGCTQEDKVWTCEVLLDMTSPGLGRSDRLTEIKLIFQDDEWASIDTAE